MASRTGGQILVDQLILHGVERRLLRARRELSRGAGRAARCAAQGHDLPRRGRRLHDGGSRRQAHRQARHLLRDARARRDQRLARHPYRRSGLDAADPVRRPDRARHARARGVSGARLPRGLRHHDEMGDGDRRCRAHPRDHQPRLPCRDLRPPRPGRDRAAGGRADRSGGCRGCAALSGDGDPPVAAADHRPAEAALGGEIPGRDPRRLALESAGDRALHALRRALRPAGRGVVPAADAVSGRSSEFCRRSRHRPEPEAAQAHQGERSRPAGRRPALRDAEPVLHAVRHSRARPAAGACPSRSGGARPGLSPVAGDQRLAHGFLRCAGDGASAAGDQLGWRGRRGA